MIHQRCTCGARFAGSSVTDVWRQMDEHWDATHKPTRLPAQGEHSSSWPFRRRGNRMGALTERNDRA